VTWSSCPPGRRACGGRSAAGSDRRVLVDELVAARLVVEDAGHFRIAHEALIRRWPRAQESPALQPDALRLGRVLTPLAATWAASGSTDDLAVAPTLLAVAAQLVDGAPGALDRYVERFVRAAAREQQRRRDRALRTARSRELAATARLAREVDQQHALELAIEAHDAASTPRRRPCSARRCTRRAARRCSRPPLR